VRSVNARGEEEGYDGRRPEESVLYGIVQAELETCLARARARGRPVPRFVEREFCAYLECGVLAHGFLRLRCDECGYDRLVPFSCKGRFCPSCAGRRMADAAAHLVDRVLPEVPVRQWVLALPFPLRMACDAALTREILNLFLRTLFASLRRRARKRWGVRSGQSGAVTFVQRFGSAAANLNPHFHTLALDGVYEISRDGPSPAVPESTGAAIAEREGEPAGGTRRVRRPDGDPLGEGREMSAPPESWRPPSPEGGFSAVGHAQPQTEATLPVASSPAPGAPRPRRL
jgi:hypothetical protein